jgi:acid phosphatase
VFSTISVAVAGVPASRHVVVVVEENHGYSEVIGNRDMPYLNSLANQYGVATQYYANTHPSIGNYFMMTVGQIITNDDGYDGTVTADNLVRHLLNAGKTWKSYAESLPYVGYTGGDTGLYIRHHNPFTYLSDVQQSQVQKNNLVPFTYFASDLNNGNLPEISFVIPNRDDDAHDGTLQQADTWLQNNISPLLNNPAFQQDGILVIVFDEAQTTDSQHGGGHVAAVVVGPHVIRGGRSSVLHQHQSLLRMMCSSQALPSCPGAAQLSNDMGEMFLNSIP